MKPSASTKTSAPDRRPGLPPLARFLLVGALNTLLDYGVFALLAVAGMPAIPAHVLSYSAALVSAYLVHRRFTFAVGRGPDWAEAARFLVVNLAALSAAGGVLLLGMNVLAIPELVAKALALPFSTGINWLGNRFWVFPKQSHR